MLFSVIICTYNPSHRLLERVLTSCFSQSLPKDQFEIILVDNNSNPSVSTSNYIAKYLHDKNFKCLSEKQQGLVYARICGIKAAASPTIVFVDDDNILQEHYLETLQHVLVNNKVGATGPGIISLEFPDGAPVWVKKHFAYMYQEKNFSEAKYGSEIEWQPYYPAGSGLAVRKNILDKYVTMFESGELTATGRKGNSFASAEDSQIIWAGIKMGYLAGISPALKIKHIIPGKRTSLSYLVNLNYGISFSYYSALIEMFPDYRLPYRKRTIFNKLAFFLKTFIDAKGKPLLFSRIYSVKNAWMKGFDDYLAGKK